MLWVIFNLIKRCVTYPPSSVQAQEYLDNVQRPLKLKLTPLRLFYYAYLFFLALRLTLYSLFQEKYTQHDLTMEILNSLVTNHMSGLCLVPVILLIFCFDFLYCLRPHRTVALMLTDILMLNKG